MIADRRSQIADRNKVCDRLRWYGNYFCDHLRSCDSDRRRSQKIEPCSISCDRLRSIAIVSDLRSAICDPRSYGNQSLDRTWFYLLRSSAITIAGSQTIAEVVSIWSQTIADLIAICDLRSAIIWKPALIRFCWVLFHRSNSCWFYSNVSLQTRSKMLFGFISLQKKEIGPEDPEYDIWYFHRTLAKLPCRTFARQSTSVYLIQ